MKQPRQGILCPLNLSQKIIQEASFIYKDILIPSRPKVPRRLLQCDRHHKRSLEYVRLLCLFQGDVLPVPPYREICGPLRLGSFSITQDVRRLSGGMVRKVSNGVFGMSSSFSVPLLLSAVRESGGHLIAIKQPISWCLYQTRTKSLGSPL